MHRAYEARLSRLEVELGEPEAEQQAGPPFVLTVQNTLKLLLDGARRAPWVPSRTDAARLGFDQRLLVAASLRYEEDCRAHWAPWEQSWTS